MKKRLAVAFLPFVHRAGDVHQMQNITAWVVGGHLDAVVVAQVEGVDEGMASILARRMAISSRRRYLGSSSGRVSGVVEFLWQPAACRVGRAEGQPRPGATHRAHHVDVGRRAVVGEAGALALVLVDAGELGRPGWGSARSSKKTSRNSSRDRLKTKSSSPRRPCWPCPCPELPPPPPGGG